MTLTCVEDPTKLRSLLSAEHALTNSAIIGGVPLKQGAVLLDADVRKVGARLDECEQVKTDAHVEFLGSKLHDQEALTT